MALVCPIQHSALPYASPVDIIPKNTGGIGHIINYNKLNIINILGQLPVSRTYEVLDRDWGGDSKQFYLKTNHTNVHGPERETNTFNCAPQMFFVAYKYCRCFAGPSQPRHSPPAISPLFGDSAGVAWFRRALRRFERGTNVW